jgi:hypothetical protein
MKLRNRRLRLFFIGITISHWSALRGVGSFVITSSGGLYQGSLRDSPRVMPDLMGFALTSARSLLLSLSSRLAILFSYSVLSSSFSGPARQSHSNRQASTFPFGPSFLVPPFTTNEFSSKQ